MVGHLATRREQEVDIKQRVAQTGRGREASLLAAATQVVLA
jgi:hypothetical protein